MPVRVSSEHKTMKKRFLGSSEMLFVSFTIVLLSALVIYLNIFMPNSAVDNWKEVRIPDGVTYSQGIGILKKEGIIRKREIEPHALITKNGEGEIYRTTLLVKMLCTAVNKMSSLDTSIVLMPS